MTRLSTQMEQAGGFGPGGQFWDLTGEAQRALRDARPLIAQGVRLAREALPAARALNEGTLARDVESLAATAAASAEDVRRAGAEALDPATVASLRRAVGSVARTVRHVEETAGALGGVSGDRAVQTSVRQLVEAVGRLVGEDY